MKRFKVFFLNSLLMIFGSLILQIIRLVFNIYVSNSISTEALGVFQLIMATYMFGITLSSSGINIACTRVISEEYALGNDYGVKKASLKCINTSIFLSIIASFIFFICSDFIVKYCFQDMVSEKIVYLICLALPLISISSAISGYFMGVRRVYKTVFGQFLEQISKIIIIVILLNVSANYSSLESICFCLILGDVLSELVSFTYLIIIYSYDVNYHFSNVIGKNKDFPITSIKSHSNENFLYRICRILVPVALTSYIKSGLSTVKQLIIPSSLKKSGKNAQTALSDYGIISGMAMPIVMFPSTLLLTVANLLIPEFSRYYVKEDYIKIKKYSDILIIGAFVFASILSIFFWNLGETLGILIYTNNEVGIYIKLFAPLIPFMYVDIIIDNILKGLDAQANVMVINIIDLLVSTLFILFFVPLWGIKGFILSIFISELLNFILSLRKLLKLERSWDEY